MGKSVYLLPQRPALMKTLDIAALLRATAARGANLSLVAVLEPLSPSPSAGTCDSTDTSFVAVDFISEAGKSERFRWNDWLAIFYFVPKTAR